MTARSLDEQIDIDRVRALYATAPVAYHLPVMFVFLIGRAWAGEGG